MSRRLHRRYRITGDELKVFDITLLGMGESSGTVFNRSQTASDGTVSGAIPAFPGFTFTTDDFITKADALLTAHPYTILSWVKTTNAGSEITSVGMTNNASLNATAGLGLDVNNKGKAYEQMGPGGQKSAITVASINDGLWHLLAGTFINSTNRKIYLDGEFINQNTDIEDMVAGINSWHIGRRGESAPDEFFEGVIGQCLIYKKLLTTEEIQSIYNVTRHKFPLAAA